MFRVVIGTLDLVCLALLQLRNCFFRNKGVVVDKVWLNLEVL